MVKQIGNLQFGIEELKSIPICDLFQKVALGTIDPLPKTKSSNKYILVVINHYSKWCEAKPMNEHTTIIIVKFLEEEIICKFGVLNIFFLTMVVNGWLGLICFAIVLGSPINLLHFQWPQCNNIVEMMIKTLKHDLPHNVFMHVTCINGMFKFHRYCLGINVVFRQSTKYSPYMILTR